MLRHININFKIHEHKTDNRDINKELAITATLKNSDIWFDKDKKRIVYYEKKY